MSQWVQAEPPALLCGPRRHHHGYARRSVAATMERPWWLTSNGAPCVHHVTWYNMVHTWCAPCHVVCTMSRGVHHVHTHGVPSALIPWYLGTCPKQFLYEIFRWPLTWPRYRSTVRTCLNPYSFLVLKKTWWYSVERVSMSRRKKVSFWLSDVTYFN